MNKPINHKGKKHKLLKGIGIVLGCMCVMMGLIYYKLDHAVQKVERLDDKGALYYAEYIGDYDNPIIGAPFQLMRGAGCSAFMTQTEEGEIITARNYDLAHRDQKGNPTGLNVILRMAPKGKYRSINVADAAWISMLGVDYYMGALDDGKTNSIYLAFLPYLCMDGINEKGLSASILALDLKEGETYVAQKESGKKTVTQPQILRLILDQCATVEEAISLAEQYNIWNLIDSDYHLFITDAMGKSVVLEWRYNKLYVTDTDAVTNFYVGFDDAEDCYIDGKFKEKFETPPHTRRGYDYGYGHGFNRFNTIVTTLDQHIIDPTKSLETVMNVQEAQETLAATAQDFTGDELTSYTQYSAIYNNTKKTLDVWVMQDYAHKYTFNV